MTNQEMIENFGDMVRATEALSMPWRIATWLLTGTLLLSNMAWAIVLAILIVQA